MIQLRLLGPVDLRDGLHGELRRVLAQPKRLAILAHLALANGGFRRRDVLLAQFWPELDAAHGRAALRQALHHLRRELGEGAIVAPSADELGIDPAAVRCDVADFVAAIAAGEDERALSSYGGELLAGVYFADASPEWEHWLDGERRRLRDMARDAARRMAARVEAAGDRDAASLFARRAFELAGEDEPAFRDLLSTLGRLGDQVGARRAYDAFEKRLAREYDLAPSAETRQLVARIVAERDDAPPIESPGRRQRAEAHSATTTGPATARRVAAPRPPFRRAIAIGLVIAAVVVAGLTITKLTRPVAPRVLAVGEIRDAAGDADAAAALSELLATQLARSAGTQVVSSARLIELATQLDSGGRPPWPRAARAAGATELIEGSVYRDSAGFRLELRRTDLVTGRALATRSVVGADVFAVAERAGASLVADVPTSVGDASLRDVVTGSVVALRFYQEGMRAMAQHDDASARRFFTGAVKEDSAFAMAVFRLAQTSGDHAMFDRALRLAGKTSDRERLIILATIAHNQDDPARMAIAETLAVRYPTEPDGLLMLGRAQIAAGRFMDATATLRRVVIMDSISLRSTGECRACAAYGELVTASNFADSLAQSERVAREFVRRAPARIESWQALASVLDHTSQTDEGRVVIAKIEEMEHRPFGELGGRSSLLQREGRYAEAEAQALRVLNAAQGDDLSDALWTHIIVLRNQGRFREALLEADRVRMIGSGGDTRSGAYYWSAQMRALVLQDLGRYREAAALRDSSAHIPYGQSSSRRGRSQASELTHEATALMLAGDTARLRPLVDSVRVHGELTGFELQRRMHHYVRGIYYRLVGRNADAIVELQKSLYSPTVGYIRANYELGRALLDAGRAREAVGVIEAALRGSLGAGGLYATRTEMELLLGQAREAAGDRAGAAAAYARVASAWERGDPIVQSRRAFAAAKAKSLEEGRQ